jgi:succinate-semialdehyde dehydrogenase/glutarate-semialdehyde dehydrogenase
MAQEMGKPVTQGEAEVEKCAVVCEYYAEHGESFLAQEQIPTESQQSFVCYRPLGVLLAVMPWNFPFWQVFRAAVPALMAGNAVALKHSSSVPGCALAIESLFSEAEFPEAVFQTLLVSSSLIGDLIADPHVSAVTLTGSTQAGRDVAAAAGKALKPIVLELGGSDPYLILEDADLSLAAKLCAKSRLLNAGQSCIAAKRFIVVPSVRKRFEKLLLERFSEARVGDPLSPGTEMGPMARRDLRDALHEQVMKSRQAGARCLLGGDIPNDKGAFYLPTLLTQVSPGMPAYDEELFGPVAAVIPAQNEEHAIHIANDTSFGLGAAVFTQNIQRGLEIARDEIHAGCCVVNDYVRSDPRLPFGGIQDSGFGRELSRLGIREFVNAKTVVVG